jgi:PST family polysaccharide transporter
VAARGTEMETPPSLGRMAAGGALVTMGGQVAKIVVQFGGVILLARLLTPRDYGLVTMVLAIVGVGEVLRDFGLSSAAIQARHLSRGQRDNLFWINTMIGLVLAAIVFLMSDRIAAFYGEPLLHDLAQAIALTFLLNGLTTQYRAHLTRELRFKRLTAAEVGGQLAGLAVAVVLALAGYGYWALVVQQIVQAAVILVVMVAAARWLPGLPKRDAEVRGFLRFGGNVMASQLLAWLSNNVGQILIGNRLGAAPLGLYNRAFALVAMPLTQLNAPATSVALPVLSRLQGDPARYAAFLLRGQAALMHFLIAVFAFACAQAGPLIVLALGARWAEAVPMFQALAIGAVFQCAGYAAYWVFMSKGLTASQLRYAVVSRTLVIACIAFGAQWGALGVAMGYAAGSALSWPLALWWLGRISDAPVRGMAGNGMRAVAGYALCGVASYGAAWHWATALPMKLAIGAAAGAAAFAAVCALWPGFRRDVAGILHTRTLLRTARN